MDAHTLYLATGGGLFVATKVDGAWEAAPAGLAGRHVTSLIAREGVILAGTRDGIWRSDNGGRKWEPASQGLEDRHVRWLAYHPEVSDLEFAGTEPAGLFVSTDGGASWTARPEVATLRDQFGWFLPYSPAAGCVRGFAFHGRRAYAAVEVGGLLRSDDRGARWALAPGSSGRPDFNHPAGSADIHPDVHSVAVHPNDPDLVYAPTGGGFYRSFDGGGAWQRCHPAGYTRAVWVDPADPDHILLGTAEPVSRSGDVAVSQDGGVTWQPAGDGLNTPWGRGMVERFLPAGGTLLAIVDDGRLFGSQIGAWHWHQLLDGLPPIKAIAAVRAIRG